MVRTGTWGAIRKEVFEVPKARLRETGSRALEDVFDPLVRGIV
jgi:hypothetical protein